MTARPFASATAFRAWLDAHHASATECVVLFWKKSAGNKGLTYAEALDEALCYGWIDGVRRGWDDDRYAIRFTPRRPGSIWSRVNVGHVERLARVGQMHPAGTAAFAARTKARTGVYSFENRPNRFPVDLERLFQSSGGAWIFFCNQPPGYQRTLIWWVVSAKPETTQLRRLHRLIAVSSAGQRVDMERPFGPSS